MEGLRLGLVGISEKKNKNLCHKTLKSQLMYVTWI